MTRKVSMEVSHMLWLVGMVITVFTTVVSGVYGIQETKSKQLLEISSTMNAMDRRLSRIEGIISGKVGPLPNTVALEDQHNNNTYITHN